MSVFFHAEYIISKKLNIPPVKLVDKIVHSTFLHTSNIHTQRQFKGGIIGEPLDYSY